MRSPPPLFFRPALFVMVAALGFVGWATHLRVQRVDYVTEIAEWSVAAPTLDPQSPTGYAGGLRRLIVPGHNNRSYEWMIQAQAAQRGDEGRRHHVDYDNAPFGRPEHSPGLYRGWLRFVAWVNHQVTGNPAALAVERAALFSDAILHGLMILGSAALVARFFGLFPAALLAVAAATLFPFATAFSPGVPDQHSLAQCLVLWSVLPLLAGLRALGAATPPARKASSQRLFLLAGIAGGGGLWIGVAEQFPIIVALALGAIAGMFLLPRVGNPLFAAPWRLWSLAGCATTLLAVALEYFPAHLTLELQAVHPVYGLAWLGLGELLQQLGGWRQAQQSPLTPGRIFALLLSVAAIALLPAAMIFSGNHGFLAPDPLASRLSHGSGVAAKNLADWIAHDGLSRAILGTGLPLLWVVPALIALTGRTTPPARRALLAVALAPLAIAFAFACAQLRWFTVLDTMLLALLVATVSPPVSTPVERKTPGHPWRWVSGMAATALAGVIAWMPPVGMKAQQALTEADVESIVERDVSHWLSQRTRGEAVVLASPDLTMSAVFHGGLRGLGTFNWENKDGLAASVRIASATSPAEALALIQQRGITHIVIPSWDSALEDFTRIGSSLSDRSFVAALKHWAPLAWLRPLPYQLPKIGGFEEQSVAIFEIVEEQEESTTLIWQTEYFVEMGQLDRAAAWRKKLQRFPGNLGALIAIAQADAATGDSVAFSATLKSLVSYLSGGADRSLAWERRVGLAAVLAQGNHSDLAREQVRRCLAEIDEARARTLTTGSLFRLIALGKKMGLEISDPKIREAVCRFLPPDAVSRLQL